MSSIPEEIYLDILLRLPAKSLLACKCVCKAWNSIISNPNFIKSHLDVTIQNNNYKLMVIGGRGKGRRSPVIILSISYDTLSSFPRNNVIEYTFEFDYPFKSLGHDIFMVYSCNGLVCLQVLNEYDKGFLVVWNPCTKEYKEIPDSPNEVIVEEIGGYAFDYDSKTDDYKLFKFLGPPRYGGSCKVDVYTLRSNSWRSIQDLPYAFSGQTSRVLVNRGHHWLARRLDSQVEYIPKVIISLDISNERFEEMQLPKEALENKQWVRNLEVLRGCLCVFVKDGLKLVVWVMQDYGVQESWTKHFDIICQQIMDYECMSLVWCFKHDEVLLFDFEDNGDLVLYDPKNASVRKLEIHSLTSLSEMENYVESLVSLNSGTYVGR